jgi:hypothetical protein
MHLVILVKPVINILFPVLKKIPYLASRFRTKAYGASSDYGPNSKYGSGKTPGGSRFNDSKGWSRTGDENIVTIGGGRGVLGKGIRGKSDLTSDGASDESILGYDRRERDYVVDGGVAVPKGGSERDGYELQGFKQGIVRTVAVDVKVSDR